ncbi:ATP-binding protein [Heyndrickxia sporothermodurans]
MTNIKKMRSKSFWIIYTLLFFALLGISLEMTIFAANSDWYIPVNVVAISLIIGMTIFLFYRISLFYKEFCKLKEEEEHWKVLIHHLPDFVCFKDGNGRWKHVNEFGRKLYQLENVDYIGKTDLELGELSPFFRKGFNYCYNSDENAWKKGKLLRVEESFAIPSGEIKSFDVLKIPLYYPNGGRKGLLTIGRDISQQKTAESMLLTREKLSVVGELAAGIAHEIRNPLTSIKGLTQLMHESRNVTDEYVKVMISEIDRINQIASELLALSKPQSRKHHQVALTDILRYVMNIMEPEALLRGVELEFSTAEHCQIEGDRNGLIQVFINLFKNAMDAMPEGGIINITSKVKGNKACVSITDQGIGIPPERLKKLGEPFFTLKEKGMGLGLTISHKIIQEHKGTIDFQSTENVGTKVIMTFPLG